MVIVEDDDDMRNLIERSLRRDPRLDVAEGGADARAGVDAIRRRGADVVILDHCITGTVMGMDSAPVIKTISPQTKVLVFTAKDLELEAYLEPEVDAYLHKDRLMDLLPTVLRLVGLDPVDL